MNPASLSTKFFIWILLAAIVPAIALIFVYLHSFKTELIQHKAEDLSQVADAKIKEFEVYINEVMIDSRLLAKSLSAENTLRILTPLFNNRDKNPNYYLNKEIEFQKYYQAIHERGYYDVFIISPEGDIILTLEHEEDFTKNIYSDEYIDTGLSHAVQRSKYFMETSISSFNYYKPSQESAIFVATPVLTDGILLGFTAIQIGNDIIQKISLNLGGTVKSRELMIGARKGNAFSFQIPLKYSTKMKVGQLIPFHKKTGPLINAMNGDTGITIDTDYRGVKTIAASRYIPSLNWGVALKEDWDDILQPYYELVEFSILTIIIIILAVIVLARYLARSVTSPLKSIIKVARSIADGNKFLKVIPLGFRENYELAESFNKMSEHLNNAQQELEQKVSDRTHELELKETSLTESETIFRQLAENINEVFWIGSVDWNEIFYISPAYKKIWGQDPESLYQNPRLWIDAVHPDDREQVIEDIPKQTSGIGEYVDFREYRIQKKDGQSIWIKARAYPIYDNTGKIVRFAGIAEDISERKHADEAIRESSKNLADAQHIAHIGSWKLDLHSNKLDWSDEIYQIFEIDSKKFDASYETFLEAIHPDDREKVNTAYTDSIKNKKPYSINHRLQMQDGRIKYVQERCETFYDDAGNPTYSNGTVQDITEQVSMEEAVRRSQKMDALGKLTGGIAHDYNNMLGVILGYTELLELELKEQPKLKKYVNEIYYAGQRGADLTNKLLSFSRKKASSASAISINDLLLDKRNMLEKTLTARIKLVFNLENNLWPVHLNDGDMEDAIVNMSINAMHAIDDTGQLTIQTRNIKLNETDSKSLQVPPGDYVQLCVTDTGSGMDKTTKEKVFEPFFTTKGEKGTGLGLSQVYGFVKRSNGAIKIYSEINHGTRIILYFLRHQETDNKNSTKEEKNIKNNITGHETILIVDDEPSLLNLTCKILKQQGYQTISANDAKEALEILKNKHIDLMLSDIIMPNMDGYQLASEVQEKYPSIKIQLASGFSDNRHIEMVDDDLHANLLHKPYQSMELLEKIRTLLDE